MKVEFCTIRDTCGFVAFSAARRMDEALINIQGRVGSCNGKPFPENSTAGAQHYEFFAAGMVRAVGAITRRPLRRLKTQQP
jgi:hypothetical protein